MTVIERIRNEYGPNSAYIEELLGLYQQDPGLVGDTWSHFFSELLSSTDGQSTANALELKTLPAPTTYTNGHHTAHAHHAAQAADTSADHAGLQERVYRMISAFRGRGHLNAKINPLSKGVMPLPHAADTSAEFYSFSSQELNSQVNCSGFSDNTQMLLSDLITELNRCYCGPIGFEFTHLLDQNERLWLQDRIENRFERGSVLSKDQRLQALEKIIHAEAFESELHRKYVGHKRFSLQGGETLIPMLDVLFEHAAGQGVRHAVIGMAHRGRLNVLANIMRKPLQDIFTEFQDQSIYTSLGSGDVKYHMGYQNSFISSSGVKLKLQLAPNPSHLEFVDPVVEGICRALADFEHGRNRQAVLPVLIHGDAAFIGQGVVPETLNLSRVHGYNTAGTVHIVLNNQIGFTTDPEESRSSTYCTDMAKAVLAPVFHVNCEDVESSVWALKTAFDFRNAFDRDVVIDLYCYRKYGHNEGDDPSFTQPVSYEEIGSKKTIAHIFAEQLIAEQLISQSDLDAYYERYHAAFEAAHAANANSAEVGEACSMVGRLRVEKPETGVEFERLRQIASTLVNYPEWFKVHPKLARILQKRVETLDEGQGIDWGFAEVLAFGSLLFDGVHVRLSGQDSGRGTFSQRHIRLRHYEGGESYFPLNALQQQGATAGFEVVNSTLSEAAVLGFEFGYSTVNAKSLVLWEAQFGDFANGAQVIIDQFIAASEAKWNQLAGVVLLLPHGYEGQGPEHSSARLERYLQLCGQGNMVVAYPSSAAQHFHLMRTQGLSEIKRPLIVMTPKSLLRHAGAACTSAELVEGHFNSILINDYAPVKDIKHVVLMSGKIFYDLDKELAELKKAAVRVIRVEQLYPFPQFELKKALKDINPKTVTWMQEEPQNQGAWSYMEPYIRGKLEFEPFYSGREAAATTATGSSKRHQREQNEIINEVLERIKA